MALQNTTGGGTGGIAGIIDDPRQADGMQSADTPDEEESEGEISSEQEKALVTKQQRMWDKARKFDENFRKQVAIDRRYAAGTSDNAWAVTTNLIGVFIDILVALLYARDPDVSVVKAPQVSEEGTEDMDVFAKTLQIVISKMWLRGKLKAAARKGVRSVLSTSEGWFKCITVAEKVPLPTIETALNDARELMERLQAEKALLDDPTNSNYETREAEIFEKEALIESLEAKLELSLNKIFVIDFIRTENMQISTDVEQIQDHLNADWNGNEIYMTKETVLTTFKRLKPKDLETAKKYYQTAPKEMTTRDSDNVLPQQQLTAESSTTYHQTSTEEESEPFYRAIEMWHATDKHIRTMVEGVEKWATVPYEPPYASRRFYPYFYMAFYEVDGQRHAQSLAWRLYKLQDEYSSVRSNFRLTRERSIPGIFVNGAQIDSTELAKVADGKIQEYIALNMADPDSPVANAFASKPVAAIDMRVYDPTYVLNDMERISGVQEALSAAISGPGNPKTATEANIQQSGTQARTTADRDNIEWCLTDMAQYAAEVLLQAMTTKDVQRMAGPKAFWPEGMSIDDIETLVEISITAGTSGKPKAQADQQAWSTILPLLKETIQQIEQALSTGNKALAQSLTELIYETMKRLGDDSDATRFIPKVPPPGTPGAGATPPPIKPEVKISLTGVLSPQAAAALAAPDLPPAPPENPNPAAGASPPAGGTAMTPAPGPVAGP